MLSSEIYFAYITFETRKRNTGGSQFQRDTPAKEMLGLNKLSLVLGTQRSEYNRTGRTTPCSLGNCY